MKKLSVKQMKSIKAGAGITGTLINSILRAGNLFITIGSYMGSGIRRLRYNQLCSF